jgi:hypothetical protein
MHMTTIRFEQDRAIGSIVLADPPFNRIDSAFAMNLRDAVHRASESNIRVLVVRAEGQGPDGLHRSQKRRDPQGELRRMMMPARQRKRKRAPEFTRKHP